METIRVGRGYSTKRRVQLRYEETGDPVLNAYTGTEDLTLVISELGADAAAVTLTACAVEWAVFTVDDRGNITDVTVGAGGGAAGTILLTLDDDDTGDMLPGPRGLTISATVDGEPIEVFRAVLNVGARPT